MEGAICGVDEATSSVASDSVTDLETLSFSVLADLDNVASKIGASGSSRLHQIVDDMLEVGAKGA